MRRSTGIMLVFLCAGYASLIAQDPRFAQFYAAPLQVNPAFNGVFEGRFRAAVNYRVLYPTLLSDRPFRTYAASYEHRFRVTRQDYLSLAGSALQDEAGTAQYLRTQASLSASLIKQMTEGKGRSPQQFLAAGLQGSVGQHSLGFNRLWFSNQYNAADNDVDFSAPSGEAFAASRSNILPDLHAGIMWYGVWDDNQSFFLGAAMHHIAEPRVSFLNEPGSRLYRRWTVHAGGEVPFTKQLSLLPGAIVMRQGPSFSITGGGNLRYTNREWKELALRAGLWAHLSNQAANSGPDLGLDAFIFTAIFELERWNLGFSYDVTASPLRRSNYSRGAFEVALTYFHPAKERHPVRCPKY